MRFTAVLVAGVLAVLARAQSSTTAPGTTVVAPSSTVSVDSAQTSEQAAITKCLDACDPGDVDCTSKCIAVPNPNSSQVNATNECVADCPKGNGTAEDNLNYSNCVDACIGKYYFTTSGTPAATGSLAGSSSSGAAAVTTGASASGSDSAAAFKTASGSQSATEAAATTSTSKGAGEALRVGTAGVGLLGFMAAFLAL